MRGYVVQVKKFYDGSKKTMTADAVSSLLKEFEAFELSPADWREVYSALLRKLTELRERYEVLAVIYRAVSLRSDYITAGKVVGKVLRNFNLLFEKLPGKPAYFVPTEAGMWLFENLIEPEKREKVRSESKRQVAIVQQLSLMSFISRSEGVRI